MGLFGQAKKQTQILEAIARPAEAKPWYQYRPIFITQRRIEKGIQFLQEHRKTLGRAEEVYGVPKEIIGAIIGVETSYGQQQGHYLVLDALTTLSFDYPPREKFFLQELEHFLLLAKEEKIDLLNVKGSYAGAMGYPQFIASSYRQYAVDFDQDGKKDLLGSVDDAIGSVANYFKQHGWETGKPVVTRAHVDGEAYKALVEKGVMPSIKTQTLKDYGIEVKAHIPDQDEVSLIELEGPQKSEIWIGHKNFYVITRYNHSALYAMAVYQLSQEIREPESESLPR